MNQQGERNLSGDHVSVSEQPSSIAKMIFFLLDDPVLNGDRSYRITEYKLSERGRF